MLSLHYFDHHESQAAISNDVSYIDTETIVRYLSAQTILEVPPNLLLPVKKKNTLLCQQIISSLYNYSFRDLSPLDIKTCTCLRKLGHHLIITTDDSRETSFLFQRICVAIYMQ